MLEKYTSRKDYLNDLIDKLKTRLATDNSFRWVDDIVIVYQAIVLLIILTMFSVYYMKCYRFIFKSDNPFEYHNETSFLSSFSKNLDNKTFTIRIPFCSSLFKDGAYKKRDSALGIIFLVFKLIYFMAEALGFVTYLTDKFKYTKRIKQKIGRFVFKSSRRITSCNVHLTAELIFLCVTSVIITLLIWSVLLLIFFVLYVVFESISLLVLNSPKEFFDFLKPPLMFNRFLKFSYTLLFTNYNNNLLVQLMLLYSMFKILDKLKVISGRS
jgi:hypothetical protein